MIRYLTIVFIFLYSIIVSYWGNLQTYGDFSNTNMSLSQYLSVQEIL